MASRWVLLFLSTVLFASSANAHLLNMSKARVELAPGGDVTVTVAVDLLRTAGDRPAYYALSQRLDPSTDPVILELLADLPGAVRLEFGDQALPLTLVSVRFPDLSEDIYLDPLSWPQVVIGLTGSADRLDRASVTPILVVRFTDEFFFEEPIATTVIDTSTGINQTRWLVTGQRSPDFDASAWLGLEPVTTKLRKTNSLQSFINYLVAGILHILPGGLDHLLFVAGLMLASRTVKQLVLTVSLFTLAHSVTLIAGALGWVQASPWLIEPLILASIIWVGVVNVRAVEPGASSRVVVFLFGLLHGFGFAGALRELELPAEQTITALLAFNVGVEIGQLTFLAILLLCYAAIAKVMIQPAALLPVVQPIRRAGGAVMIAVSIGLALGLAGVI